MAKKVSEKKGFYFRASARKQNLRRRRGFSSEPREEQNPRTKRKGFYFVCPKHGRIPRDEVVFLCNTCGPTQLHFQNGLYLCPQCLKPGDNFQCFLCGSKKVEMKKYGK
ncbi:hypothetical protein COT70_02290 [candidate division WWE3 bacterium CG09_land_8_20_14_0_10_47_33]|nr:MAG: hypothetical protein COT70_02290 [candidate division WWE3 bacterium CG09_land_8_20_14_0_10_47_33]PIZ41598.1 MAG: hypothetical protein COY35_00030 [candidate division WWE3 bacterium CG_4_10_14_0_2_um_filter_47_8]PJE51946.1 MAG: hypothetical protein COV28_01375 [candidate division WWE3 bacterium CG10_big_fil_rev_8_21_14_0_10_48_23]